MGVTIKTVIFFKSDYYKIKNSIIHYNLLLNYIMNMLAIYLKLKCDYSIQQKNRYNN